MPIQAKTPIGNVKPWIKNITLGLHAAIIIKWRLTWLTQIVRKTVNTLLVVQHQSQAAIILLMGLAQAPYGTALLMIPLPNHGKAIIIGKEMMQLWRLKPIVKKIVRFPTPAIPIS